MRPGGDNAVVTSNARLVQRLGLAIVAAGLAAAAAVHVRGADDPEVDAVEHQREMRELERLGGTASVRTAQFDQWLSSLWHGRRLAGTLAALALVVGGGCWRVGALMGEGAEDDA